jgi:hypothetical protein
MNNNDKTSIGLVIVYLLFFTVLITSTGIYYHNGFNDGVASVETRTPSFETAFTGGYVNESVYASLYNFTYPFSDSNPPIYHNDSFVIGISIYAYYDGPTGREQAFFGVKFSMMNLYYTNISIDLVSTLAERYSPPGGTTQIVGFSFNLENLTAATAFAYGQMTIMIFGHGAILDVPTVIRSCTLTIIEWEGDE